MTQDVEMKEVPAPAPSNSVTAATPSTLQRKIHRFLCFNYLFLGKIRVYIFTDTKEIVLLIELKLYVNLGFMFCRFEGDCFVD